MASKANKKLKKSGLKPKAPKTKTAAKSTKLKSSPSKKPKLALKASTLPAKPAPKVVPKIAIIQQKPPTYKVHKAQKVRATERHSASDETICREVACDGSATTGGYCRMHYIKNWKKIKRKELILKEKKLNRYIEELVTKYPDKYIEAIRQDLVSDKDFSKVIHDLELDEGIDDFEAETEPVENIVDTIKRDSDEEESF